MHGMKPLMVLCVVGSLLASGCTSMRVTTNLKPDADPALASPAGTFHIAGVTYTAAIAGKDLDLNKAAAQFESQLLPVMREECVARYPALFRDDTSTSIPVWVEVHNTTTLHEGKMVAWMFGTALLVGLIFPCPADMELDVDVKVGLWNGRDGMAKGAALQKSFRNGMYQWVSLLTPLALIPIPGESDFPKSSFMLSGDQAAYTRAFAQQVAAAIAKLIAEKDPVFWTTPAQEPATPQQGQDAISGALPTALPMPKDSVAPF